MSQAILLLTTRRGVLLALLYTPGQLRDATSLPVETYRHWKKALAPMRRDVGHSPSFTLGDLVAVSVVRLLTEDFGIKVGTLSPLAESLFAVCNQFSWPILERSVLTVEVAAARVTLLPEQAELLQITPAIIIPLAVIIKMLRNTMLAVGGQGEQESLRFPPTVISTAAGGRS